METRLSILLAIYAGIAVCLGAKWSYSGKSGPKYWHELFPTKCSGKAQSPIDLDPEMTVYSPNLKDFAIWYDPPKPDSKMIIKNNGHAVQVDLQGEFFVSNGGLTNVFRALQFHFHWGHKSHQGSEHLISGVASPIEMHLVTYNHDKYVDIGEAVTEPDGLAVLGVMFKISPEDNPKLEPIVKALKFIKDPEQLSRVELPLFSLRDMLPHDISRYYRYQGSLTTPACFESVTWTVFQEMQTISKRQLAEFRKLLQYRRLHKHNKANRHKRSLTSEEKQMEHQAEKVLDELGIRGNTVEETILANEMTKMKSAANQASATSKVVNGGTGDDNHAPVPAPTPTAEPQYTQDVVVNNFRPIQPLNGRIVYRSFNLKEVYYREFEEEHVVSMSKVTATETKEDDGDGASSLGVSFITLLLSLLCFIVREKVF